MPTGMRLVGMYFPLIPSILGLCFARAGLIVASYGSYNHTDEGIFTDGGTLVALSVMGVIFIAIAVGKLRLKRPLTNRIMRACIILETACIIALPSLHLLGALNDSTHFLLSAATMFFGSFAIFYWLRRARGCGSTTAVLYVFSALAISEIEIYVCSLIGNFGFFLAGALALGQLPCMLSARKNKLANDIDSFTPHDDYFGFAKTALSSKHFLSASAISIGFLSVVDGFLRGYPDGQPIAFQPGTRVAYFVLTVAVFIAVILLMLNKRRRVMTVGMFILMELLACIALILYAAFPDMLDIGAVFTTTLNALMVAFTWYIIIALMSFGWRDPYYYALAGWIVWLGCRAISRVLLISNTVLTSNDILTNAVMGASVVISTQVALGQFLSVSQAEADERDEGYVHQLEQLQKQLNDAHANVETMAYLNVNDPAYAGCATCAAADGNGPAPGSNAQQTLDALRCAGVAPKGAGEVAAPIDEQDGEGDDGGRSVRGARLARLMGLDESESITDIRKATMRQNAKQMGKQFLLSDREIEVLALYAMGWTQKRVAEELYISPSTAHAHIKRIYAKTGLHSRQEILDFMDQYTS